MDTTSITIKRETKERLVMLVHGKETWDETIRRIIDGFEEKKVNRINE